MPREPLLFKAGHERTRGHQQLSGCVDSLDTQAVRVPDVHRALDRTAVKEGHPVQELVDRQKPALPQRKRGPHVVDVSRSLSRPGNHLVRGAVRTQHDQFLVGNVRDYGAAVREEAAGVDPLEGVVARIRTVAVQWLRRELEGCIDFRHPVILDDPYAGAVFGLDRDACGLADFTCAPAGAEADRQHGHQHQDELGSVCIFEPPIAPRVRTPPRSTRPFRPS